MKKPHVVFDPIYGFIQLTPTEWKIIHSPFYQRLRWVKQLGFSFYVFPGAEHSRFGHSIGVMNNAHAILKSCGRAVDDHELMDTKNQSKEAIYHRSVRLGALLHDLGTFPFSHTTEMSYIRFGETTNKKKGKGLPDDHENLGSFIIKNTKYDGGMTQILEDDGLDPQVISDLVKGVHSSIMANQILHSEVDCDRMDYLLRDAHYTGLKYGAYDREYLTYHFQPRTVGGHEILTIKHNALHCVEDFLMSRFAWYSQVIRSPRGAKYDAIAETLCYYLLENGKIHKYSELLDMISSDPMKFYRFNDNYFMSILQETLVSGEMDKNPGIKDMARTLLLESGANAIRIPEFRQRLISQDDPGERDKVLKQALAKVDEIQKVLETKGGSTDWMIADLPKKDIIFVKSAKQVAQKTERSNVLLERDPVKISYESGEIKLLAEVENSIISRLHHSNNYIPNVFCSRSAHDLLKREGIIEG